MDKFEKIENDLWPLLRATEKALRNVITTTMTKAYGNDWIKSLEKERPNLKKIFDECRNAQQKEEKSFGERASQNLIDFTYPADLFAIICAKGLWNSHFHQIFGHNPNYWDQRKQLLAKCRNPLHHHRDVLESYKRRTVEAYCEEILTILADYTE